MYQIYINIILVHKKYNIGFMQNIKIVFFLFQLDKIEYLTKDGFNSETTKPKGEVQFIEEVEEFFKFGRNTIGASL